MPTPSRKRSKTGRAMTPNAFRRLVARLVVGRQNKQAFSYGMLEESIIVAKAKQTSTTTEKNGAGGATEVKGNLHAEEPFIVLDYSRADDQVISVLTLDPAIRQQAVVVGEPFLLHPTTSSTSGIHTANTNNATAIPRSFDGTGRVPQAMENRYYASSTTSLDPSRDDFMQNKQPRNESPWRSKPTRACWI